MPLGGKRRGGYLFILQKQLSLHLQIEEFDE